MKYMGSKSRIAKDILPIVLQDRKYNQWYVEPFAGGMNSIDKVQGKRLANDINFYLISMWQALIYDRWEPRVITRELYNDIRANTENYSPYLVGWAGFNCSYGGKYFGGFAGKTNTKIGTVRDYQSEAIKNVLRQVDDLQGVRLTNRPFYELDIPDNSIIYCDPPYKGTTKFANKFDHDLFWEWVRVMDKSGHIIYVSKYNAPDDFECIWVKGVKSSLSANGRVGGSKASEERLFRMNA